MSIDTCTMLRRVIRARSVIINRSDILERTILFTRGFFMRMRREPAERRRIREGFFGDGGGGPR